MMSPQALMGGMNSSAFSGLSETDKAALEAMWNLSGQSTFTQLLGYFPGTTTPPTGAPSESASTALGMFGLPGNPYALQSGLGGLMTLGASQGLGTEFGQPTQSYDAMMGYAPETYNTPFGKMSMAQMMTAPAEWQGPLIDWINQLQGLPPLSSGSDAGGDRAAITNPVVMHALLQDRLSELSSIAPGIQGIKNAPEATLQAKQMMANLIMSAQQGFADPFTYLSKMAGLMGNNALRPLMENALTLATGQPLSQLQNQSNLTNSQLANMTATNMFNPGGGSAGAAGAPNGTMSSLAQTMLGASGAQSGLGALGSLFGRNPGFQTPGQAFLKAPSSVQSAINDLQQQGVNGQTTQDFMQQMKMGLPGFAKSANATMGNVEGI